MDITKEQAREIIRKARARIEKYEGRTVDIFMKNWVWDTSIILVDDLEDFPCGTPMCMAGNIAYEVMLGGFAKDNRSIPAVAREVLAVVTGRDVTHFIDPDPFYVGEWPSHFDELSPKQGALRILDNILAERYWGA